MFRYENFVITIDGPAGVGKTTVAKRVAAGLTDFAYLDTGAVYRAMALALDTEDLTAQDMDTRKGACLDAIYRSDVSIRYDGSGRQCMCLDSHAVRDELLRTQEMSDFASRLSADPIARLFARYIIQNRPQRRSIVAEGRDAGTVLFPDARLKFYLYAPSKTRAKRRMLQAGQVVTPPALAKATDELRERDNRDISRGTDPLKMADDAIWLDTYNLSEDTVVDIIIGAAKARLEPEDAPLA